MAASSTARRRPTLQAFVEATGIPVSETKAGKGSHCRTTIPRVLGAVGFSGGTAANLVARDADLIIGIGTRYTDFTTASKTQFQNPDVRFININVAELDAYKHAALPLQGDARVVLEELAEATAGYRVPSSFGQQVDAWRDAWIAETDQQRAATDAIPLRQGHVLGVVNDFTKPRRRGGLRCRQLAGRPSQAMAHRAAGRLPPGVRLLLHGL